MLDWRLVPAFFLTRAGRWFLESGIQEPLGGVARFYRSEIAKNKPVSTEITGYTASALIYLFEVTGEEIYLERARHTAHFLLHEAWDDRLGAFPFEHPSPSPESHHHTYFFDCGIIVRGLMAVWRHTRDANLLEVAHAASLAMVGDFHSGSDYHPILSLPSKDPLPRLERWSRLPGCYQLKAALGWYEVSDASGDWILLNAWNEMLNAALAAHRSFLDPADASPATMDRLHAYCYFLEALTPMLDHPACMQAYAEGIATVSGLVRLIEPVFVRSDVLAQLLRARILGRRWSRSDAPASAQEATQLPRSRHPARIPASTEAFYSDGAVARCRRI